MYQNKLRKIMGVALLCAGQLASAAGQNAQGPAARGNDGNAEANLNGCRRDHCVLVKLPNRASGVGTLELFTKDESGVYQKALGPCSASGGWSPHADGQRSIKTPAGTHGVLETADRLLYNGNYVNMYNATYFHDPDPLNIRTSNRVAIHSGHVDGQNSHGCVRTTASCAEKVRDAADDSGLDMQVKVAYF